MELVSNEDPAPALARGLHLLKRLHRDGPSNLEQLAHGTGWPKASVLRLLQSLKSFGAVERDPGSKRYYHLMQLTPVPDQMNSLHKLCRSVIIQTAEKSLQTTEFHIFHNKELQMLDRADPPHISSVNIKARVGWKRNLDELDALTQLVLAFSLTTNPKKPLPFWHWSNNEKRYLSSPDVKRIIQEVRCNRMAVDLGINPNGIRRYAAPVLNSENKLLAVLAIAEEPPSFQAKPKKQLSETIHKAGILVQEMSQTFSACNFN